MWRLQAQLKRHTKVAFSIASSSSQMNTQWSHQRFFSELKSTIQILTSLVESASISWRTNGLLLFRLDRFFSQSRLWCLFQTWMILWIRKLRMPGRLIKRPPSRRPRSGPSNMPTIEQWVPMNAGTQFDLLIRHINVTNLWRWIPLDCRGKTKSCFKFLGLFVMFDRWKAEALKFDLRSLCHRHCQLKDSMRL